MRRLALLPLIAVLAVGCAETPVDPVTKGGALFRGVVQTTSLGSNLTLITGAGGNILAITGADGTTLLDTGVTTRVADLDAALVGLDAEPVTTVVDTHFHFDHTGGNAHYGKQGATIVAHENVRKRLSAPQKNFLLGVTFPPAPAEALPTQTFSQQATLKAAGHTLQLVHPAANAHTDSDSYVFIPDANVLFAGDLFFNGFYPLIDYNGGGNIDGVVKGADAMLAITNDRTRIVAGHGALATRADLKTYRDMLATIAKRIHALMAQGKTEAQIIAAKPTADFDAKWAGGFFTGDAFTEMVYRGLVVRPHACRYHPSAR